jgi:hypothetical protein
VREYPAEGAALHPDVIPGPRGGRPPDFVLLIIVQRFNDGEALPIRRARAGDAQ